MKLNKNILIAGAAVLGMTACQPEVKQPTDAEIDVLVQAKVDEVKATLQKECDNSIMAMATAKADSIMVAAANRPQIIRQVVAAPAPKPAPKKKVVKTKKTPVKEPVKTNPKSEIFKKGNNGKKTVTAEQTKKKGEIFKKGADAKKTVTPEQTKKKGDIFKK